jgi:hypothetical protein
MGSSTTVIRDRLGLVVIVATFALIGHVFAATVDATKTEADRLIATAIQAEIGGDIPQAIASMQNAVRTNPGNQLARWRSGQLRVDGQWTTVEEAQRRASGDPRQAQYRQLCMAASETADDQLALAKWCRKYRLNDEARFHWANVLKADPNDKDALRALDLRWYRGKLLSVPEIARLKNSPSAREREHYEASLTKWRKALAGKANVSWKDVLAEIQSVNSVEAIASIEELLWHPELPTSGGSTGGKTEPRQDVSLVFVAALKKMSEQPATEALVRQAVFSQFAEIRTQTIDELKKRPLYDYVPMLLDGLELPVQSSYHVEASSDGKVHYVHTLRRPGATADYEEVHTIVSEPYWPFALLQPSDPMHGTGLRNLIAFKSVMEKQNLELRAANVEAQVANANSVTAERDGRIVEVLSKTTGQKFGNEPRKWWDYWQNQNEYYVSPEHPVYQQYHNSNEKYCLSCFVKGTPIWTKTGRRPVESLEVGDLVLSQNVDTGELKYEPVIRRTVRPPSQILKVSTDGDKILATKGHPFWVAGVGWRMAKELGDGAVLCGLTRATRVRSIEPAGEAEAYNLVVANLNTYFVGESGILVHDNTPRRPTRTTVPGVIAKKEAAIAASR